MDLVSLLAACAFDISAPNEPLCRSHASISLRVSAMSSGAPIERWQAFIDEASRRFAVPASWIRAVMAAESGGRTVLGDRPITSPKGAMGLMQLMPKTWTEMRLRLGLGSDPYDPHDNILAGGAYLRSLYDRYGYPGCFAAYNAGPDRFDDYLRRGVALPDETLKYLSSIGPGILDAVVAAAVRSDRSASFEGGRRAEIDSGSTVFFALGQPPRSANPTTVNADSEPVSGGDFGLSRPASDGLFVPLRDPLHDAEGHR